MLARGVAFVTGIAFAFFALRAAAWYWYLLDAATLPWWEHAVRVLLVAFLGGMAWLLLTWDATRPAAYVDPRRPSDARAPDQPR